MKSAHAVVARCEAGEISPAVALMELLMLTQDADAVGAFVREVGGRSGAAAALAELFEQNEGGCRRIAAMLKSGVDRPPQAATVDEGVAFCRTLFDWSVRQSETASVALYSLGSPELLAAATAEIVELLRSYGLLAKDRAVLDLGCGTGRMGAALACEVGHVHGIDVSGEMVLAARRRTAALPNVSIALSSGLDLQPLAVSTFDLVLAVDSFPYVVQAGWALAATMFEEAARVLRPGGELVILSFSYRGDRALDRRDVRALAEEHGFDLLVNGELPFKIWNGDVYRMRHSGHDRARDTSVG
jgi:cyclopropane fatty-acyl-phospholipid synthase-like methyltransferase